MNKEEARQVLPRHLEQYRGRSYAELIDLIDTSDDTELVAPSGTTYQIRVQAVWDDGSHQNLRVSGAIDDGGWRAFAPLVEDFILAANGAFVGE
jgi:predicted heme/steroid binding protein